MANTRQNKINDSAKTVLISQNPKSGAGNRSDLVERLATRLRELDLTVEVIQDIDQLEQQVQRSTQTAQLRCVVSAGGDGTVSLLLNRLPTGTPLFVFPLGTANLLAKYLGTNLNIEATAQTILTGHTTTIDVGKANGQLFVVVASCGFDADVVHRLHAHRSGHISYASYLWPVAQSIFSYPFDHIKLVADGSPVPPAAWSFVFNVPKYAIGLQICPDADPQDGQLDYCSLSKGGFWRGLGYFFAVLFRQHQNLPSSHFSRFTKLEIKSGSQTPLPFELDGDPAGFTPVTIEIVPAALTLVVAGDNQ